jgi:hypothetical protein
LFGLDAVHDVSGCLSALRFGNGMIDAQSEIKSLKITKTQIEILYEAHQHRDELPGPLVHTVCGNALVRKGLMYHYYAIYGEVWSLTDKGIAIATLIRKAQNVVPLRRSA